MAILLGSHVLVGASFAETCAETITATDGYVIRRVDIRPRHLGSPPATELRPGEMYNPTRVAQLVGHVSQEMNLDRNSGGTSMQFAVASRYPVFEMGYARSCTVLVPPAQCKAVKASKCVDIRVDVFSIRFDPNNLLANQINTARSPETTYYKGVPRWLLLTNPAAGIAYDKAAGVSPKVDISIPLSHARSILSGDSSAANDTDRFDLTLHGSRSLDRRYYDASGAVTYGRQPGKRLQTFHILVGFDASSVPAGTTAKLTNSTGVVIGLRFKPFAARADLLHLDLGGARAWHRFGCLSGPGCVRQAEPVFSFRSRFQTAIKGSLNQLQFQVSTQFPEAAPYRSASGSWSFEHEFGKGHSTVGIRMVLQGGAVFGDAPPYGLFFGGGMPETGDGVTSVSPRVKDGPIIRSFGRGQFTTGTAGTDEFFGVSVDLTIPVRAWSSPLIPEEEICDEYLNPPCQSLAGVLKGQVDLGKAFLAKRYRQQGLSSAEADAAATRDLASARPVVEFVADHANLYSVKPLIMYDFVRADHGVFGTSTASSVGGGLELTLVVAKFRIGYAQTIANGFSQRRPGNVVLGLRFTNFF